MRPDPEEQPGSPAYLRKLIRKIGWTQREVAEHIGMPLRTLAAKLGGTRPIHQTEVMALEKIVDDLASAETRRSRGVPR